MTARVLALPAASIVAVAAVLGVQLGHGGGSFSPLRAADPCATRHVTSTSTGIDALVEKLVLLGLDGAACRLHVSREALTLDIASSGRPSDAQVAALHAGLRDAVRRLKTEGELPKASALVDEVVDTTDMNALLKAAIKALPASVVDGSLKTDDVLTRTVDDLDLRAVLTNLDDRATLESQVTKAVVPAVRDALVERLRGFVP